jgi:3-oxoacyl-[acyl-carrier-protein] synthase I
MPESVVVTGIGMRTTVGNDAVQSAAAVRAGINRFALWTAMGVSFEDEAGVLAASLPEDLGDLPWTDKAFLLVPAPLHEALWRARLYDLAALRAKNQRLCVGAYLAVPYPDRLGVSDEELRQLASDVRELGIVPACADAVQIIACEHAAGITALAQAARELVERKVDVAVVGGLDSLLHTEHLQSLWQEGRLKLPIRADGLIPGEAAAVAVLERAADAGRRKARPLARLGPAGLDRETVPIGPEHPIRAEAASRAVVAALAGADEGAAVDQVYMDMSGERWRSLEWALVETRCLGKLAKGWQLWHPADCLGDIGAASSLVHLALAVRGFERGYGGRTALLCAASYRGERAALTIHSAKEAGHAGNG